MLTNLPKTILHEHLEGSITPKMANYLAKKNNVVLPAAFFYADGAYDQTQFPYGRYNYDESQFDAFIRVYDHVAGLIQTPQDYYLITKDFLSRNAELGMIYCELLISPYHMCATLAQGKITWDLNRYDQILARIKQAIDEVNTQYPLTVRLHATGVRHLGPEVVQQTLLFIQQHPHQLITGFNIAGNELHYHFDDFFHSHQLAKTLGLGCAYHAGEIGSDQHISDAINAGATRIGHGIRAIDNNELIERLIANKILLEIAMTSNRILVTQLQGDIHQHPIRKLYDLGVRISINTDDAGIFGTDINKEYQIAQQVFGFQRLELLDIVLCSIEAAFVTEQVKQQLIATVYHLFNQDDIQQLQQLIDSASSSALKQRLQARQIDLKKLIRG